MKTPTHLHTTNYLNTFIEIAEDCPTQEPVVPPLKGEKLSVANLHFDMIALHPYRYSSDDVVFGTFAEKNDLVGNLEHERALFFPKDKHVCGAHPSPNVTVGVCTATPMAASPWWVSALLNTNAWPTIRTSSKAIRNKSSTPNRR